VLHKALQQAVELGYIRHNPANACKLPRTEKAEIKALDNDAISRFIEVIKSHRFEIVYLVTLFTGMREGEVLGLTWNCIDFDNGTITINKQLQRERGGTGVYHLVSTKNGKSRHITPAPSVLEVLKDQERRQSEWRVQVGEAWEDSGLVFTDEIGHNLSAQTVYLHFKKLAAQAGYTAARFHDLRHSYAVAALQSGDDIKTVQENLEHHTAAFTLDVYGHVTERMKQESASRMEQFIKRVSEPAKGKYKGKQGS
jgi:integrase